MTTEELREALSRLSDIEREIILDSLNYHTLLIIGKMFPENEIIKGLIVQKKR